MHCLAYHYLLAPISIFIAPLSLIPFCSAINALALGRGGGGAEYARLGMVAGAEQISIHC